MQQIKLLKTITAIFLVLSCLFALLSCSQKKNFGFLSEPYRADISWESGGHTFCAELCVGERSDALRTVHMRVSAPDSLAGMTLIHAKGKTSLTYGELALGEEMCARYFAIARCAVPVGGLKHLSRTESGGDVYVDADGKWWYFEKDSQLPSAAEYDGIKIKVESFNCKGQGTA